MVYVPSEVPVDLSLYALTSALADYVPYSGAGGTVNLNTQNLVNVGQLGVGVTSPVGGIDLVRSGTTQLRMTDTANPDSDAVRIANVVCRSRDPAEEDICMMYAYARGWYDDSVTWLSWGGGNPNFNAVTHQRFWAAANHTTVTGTKILEITIDGADFQSYDVWTTGYLKGKHKAANDTAGVASQSETGVTNFDIVITDGLITSFTKN